jgi:hypothetical protein
MRNLALVSEEFGAGLANFRAKQNQPQVLGCDTLAFHFKTVDGSHSPDSFPDTLAFQLMTFSSF